MLAIWEIALLVTAFLFVCALALRSFMQNVRSSSTTFTQEMHSQFVTMTEQNLELAARLNELQTIVHKLNKELNKLNKENQILHKEVAALIQEISTFKLQKTR